MRLQDVNSEEYSLFVFVRDYFSKAVGVNFRKRGNAEKNRYKLDRWGIDLSEVEISFLIAYLDDDSSLFEGYQWGGVEISSLSQFGRRYFDSNYSRIRDFYQYSGLGTKADESYEVYAILIMSDMLDYNEGVDVFDLIDMYLSHMD